VAAAYPKGVRNKVAYNLGTLLDNAIVPGSVEARHAQSQLEHVRDLNAWAQQTAQRAGRKVPSFDPRSGGTHASVLILMQDPSRVAQYGSRMISRDNNDQTAHNTAALCDAVGLDYSNALHWNVVPWWVRDPDLQNEGSLRSLRAEAIAALPYLRRFLEMVQGSVTRVVLVGKQAEHAWLALQNDRLVRSFQWRACPHTSPLAYNRSDNRDETRRVFEWAAS
jgi:hypothetical protein